MRGICKFLSDAFLGPDVLRPISFPLFRPFNRARTLMLYPPPECTDLRNPRKGRRREGGDRHVGPSDVKINIGLYHRLNKQ